MLDSATPETNRLVIYYNSNATPLSSFAATAYTHVILSFARPDASGTMVLDGNLTATVMGQIPTLKSAGKKVMLALGGGACSSSQWQQMAGNIQSAAGQLAAMVQTYGLDGIDIDFEDSAAFTGGAGYDGTQFLINLTQALYGVLPAGARLISHAPQAPYFFPGWSSAYPRIMDAVGAQIDFLNIQYYNNPNFQEPSFILGTSAGSVAGMIAAGIPHTKIVIGKPVGPNDAGSGWMPVSDIAGQIVTPLVSIYGSIGGAMGWQAASDPTGSWGATLAAAMAPAAAVA